MTDDFYWLHISYAAMLKCLIFAAEVMENDGFSIYSEVNNGNEVKRIIVNIDDIYATFIYDVKRSFIYDMTPSAASLFFLIFSNLKSEIKPNSIVLAQKHLWNHP